MQCRAALWILGAFHTSPTGGIKALAGLILFISISRSWPSDPVLGLLRFLLSMYYSLFLMLTTPRVLIPIHSPLLFLLMHRVLGWGALFLILKCHFLILQNASIHSTLRYAQDIGYWTTFLTMSLSILVTAPMGALANSSSIPLTDFVMRPPLIHQHL